MLVIRQKAELKKETLPLPLGTLLSDGKNKIIQNSFKYITGEYQYFKKGTLEVLQGGKDGIQKVILEVSFNRCLRFL